MKEDVLEQIVDDYLQFRGYFTTHNVRFRPRPDHPDWVQRDDSVPSDIDVVGYQPRLTGSDKVMVVTCKAWQGGFGATSILAQLRGEKPNPKRARWREFRELWVPKWSEALTSKVADLTGESAFSYRIAVTYIRGNSAAWADDETIGENLGGSSFGFLTLEEMWQTMLDGLTTTPAASEVGRLAQLLKAARLTSPHSLPPPLTPPPGSDSTTWSNSPIRSDGSCHAPRVTGQPGAASPARPPLDEPPRPPGV